MNGYNLLRTWFNFRFENGDKCRAAHTEMYCYLVDQWNRLGQKEQIGLPTKFTMECLGMGSYNTYKKTLKGLIDFGFVYVISDSNNQWQSKIVGLSKIDKPLDKPLDKATAKARDEALDKPPDEALDKPPDTISKQVNKGTKEQGEPRPKKSPEKQTPINTKKENPNPSAGEKLVLWLEKECLNVQKMDSPITTDEADRLVKDYRQRLQELKDVFISMDNHKGLKKKYVSANRTFRSWMTLRDKKAEESGNKQNPQTIKSLPSSAENNVEPKFKSAAMERIEQNQN